MKKRLRRAKAEIQELYAETATLQSQLESLRRLQQARCTVQFPAGVTLLPGPLVLGNHTVLRGSQTLSTQPTETKQ